jgi:hypothetical protein
MTRRHRLLVLLSLALVVPAVPAAGADAPPPPNDDVTTPTSVTQLPFADRLDVAGATRAPDDPELTGPDCWPTPERTVWYAFTPEQDVRVAADTFGSDHDTVLAAYAITPGGLVELACNDDVAGTPQSRVHLDLPAGWLAVPLRVEWGRTAHRQDWSGVLTVDGGEVLQTPWWSREIRSVSRATVAWEAATHGFGGGGLYGPTRGGVDVTLVGPPQASVAVDAASGSLTARLGDLQDAPVDAIGANAPDDSILRLQPGTGAWGVLR